MRLSHRLLRNVHLAAAPIVGAFVYAKPLRENEAFAAVVQWGVFPLVAVAGLALWMRGLSARRAANRAPS
ncbi:MAG: hypothetical protein RL014_533 [Pseudomonadota bacterium]